MPAVYVVPQFINGPKKPGGKFGSIKTAEQGYISVPAAELYQFEKGRKVCIEMEIVGDYKNYIRMASQQPQQGGQAPQPRAAAQRQAAPRRAEPQETFSQQFDVQALNIFVTGVTGRALGSGHFNAGDIGELVKEAKTAFLKHLVPPAPTSAPEPEFNDPVPNFYEPPQTQQGPYRREPGDDQIDY